MMRRKLNYDYAKFESIMEKEISNRKMLGNLSSTQSLSEFGLMDQFFLFGIPPSKEKNPVPTVMAAFPPFRQSSIPVENILSLSMPNWDFSNSSSKTKTTSIFSASCDNGVVDEFVFQFNSGETKMYGVCSHIQPSKAIRSSTLPFFATDSTKKQIFCMCLITRLPIFNAHFTFLNYLANLSAGTFFKKIDNTNPTEPTFESKYETDYRVDRIIQNDTLIEGLELTGTFGQILGITIPEEFQSKVFDYYSKTLYSSSFKLAPGFNIRFPPPTTPEQRLISWASLDTLFSVLNVRDIVELLAALILDAQVLIVGSSMQEVSMTVYGLYALLTPFKYCGIVMPILPNNDHYLELLNSPTPFIFGMPNIQKLKKMTFLESTYIVNVDKHKMPPVNYFPKYPSYTSVVKKVSEIVASKDNTAFTAEDELLEINRGMKERSRSAIIAVNTIPGTKQIRIKPNFSPVDRRKNNQTSRTSINLNQMEKPPRIPEKVDSTKTEKIESANSFPSFTKPQNSEKVESTNAFPSFTKPHDSEKVDSSSPFPSLAKTENSEKTEDSSAFPSLIKTETSTEVENNNAFPSLTKTENSDKVENKSPFPIFGNRRSSIKTESNSHFPSFTNRRSSIRTESNAHFPSFTKPGAPDKVESPSAFPSFSQTDTSPKAESTSQFPSFTKPETPDKVESKSAFPSFSQAETSPKDESTSAFPSFTKPETPDKVENKSAFPSFSTPRTLQKAGSTNHFPSFPKPDNSDKVESPSAFPSFSQTETSPKVESTSAFPSFTKPETSDKVEMPSADKNDEQKEKQENDTNDESEEKLTVQFPNFGAFQSNPVRRRNTCMHIKFSAPIPPPAQQPSQDPSEPLCDFPTFNKPEVAGVTENDINPYKFPQDLTKKLNHKVALSKDSIDKIIEALHEPLETIFTDDLLNCYFVTNSMENITIFNQELFLASVKPEDQKFYEFLLESQTFQSYVETKLTEFTTEKDKETGQRRKSTFGPKTKRRASTAKKPFTS